MRVRYTDEEGLLTEDSWIRDYGPLFALSDAEELQIHHFGFNSWGGKYSQGDLDQQAGLLIGERIAGETGASRHKQPLILEGGSVDFDGRATLLTTESCLTEASRAMPGTHLKRTRENFAAFFETTFGIRKIIWLSGKLKGDDTDGHIDTMARWIAPAKIAAILPEDPKHPDYDCLVRNWQILEAATDASGHRLSLVPLPAAPKLCYAFPDDPAYDIARDRLPSGYANFLLCNRHLFLPVYESPSDALAIQRLTQAMPGWRIVPIPSRHLIIGLGSLHCLSMQQTASR